MGARCCLAGLVALGMAGCASRAVVRPGGPSFIHDGHIAWFHQEAEALAKAKSLDRPVMIDFYADWCSSCMELDKHVYTDPRVRDEVAARFVPMKVDCTNETPAVTALEQKYGITSLPTVLFLDPSGHPMPSPQITEYIGPDDFLSVIGKVP